MAVADQDDQRIRFPRGKSSPGESAQAAQAAWLRGKVVRFTYKGEERLVTVSTVKAGRTGAEYLFGAEEGGRVKKFRLDRMESEIETAGTGKRVVYRRKARPKKEE